MKIRVWYVVEVWTYDEFFKIYAYKDFYEYAKGPMSYNEAFEWMIDNQSYNEKYGKRYDMIYDYIETV